MTFFDIALPLIQRGVKVIRLRPRTKIAIDLDWPSLATTDPSVIGKWSEETPEANCACVADKRLGGLLFVEIDSPELPGRYEKETGLKLPNTFRVRSSPGRGHLYLAHTTYSLENLGNISQSKVLHKDFSVRVDHAYCVSPGSIHPTTGNPYELMSTGPILELPNALVDWILAQREEKVLAVDNSAPIPSGSRNSVMASLAGALRNKGLDREMIETVLLDANEKRCQPPLSSQEIQTIAWSISRYAPAKEINLTIGGKAPELSGPQARVPSETIPAAFAPDEEPEEELVNVRIPHPVFPNWIMNGTSLYENFIKPICDQNDRYPEFMWVPAMAVLLNYLGGKVTLEHNRDLIPSVFMVVIGRQGRIFKSSSIRDVLDHFRKAGVLADGPGVSNAEGKSLIWTIGSPEGLGKEMGRTKCKNAILYYDELSNLVNKAGIDSSSLTSQLLTLYESGNFENTIKAAKDNFSHPAGTYTATLMAATTDKNFLSLWSKLSGATSGLNERFFFLFQPPEFKKEGIEVYVNTFESAVMTRKLIEKALAQKVYRVSDLEALKATGQGVDNRQRIRLQKFALGFAVDLGLDEIDEDCIERALHLVQYEDDVKNFLKSFEGYTKEATAQQEILHLLAQNEGRMKTRDIEKKMHSERYGMSMWFQIYQGLIKSQWVREEGKGTRNSPKITIQLRAAAPEEN